MTAYALAPPGLSYPPHAETSAVPLLACPVKASMGVLSKKWTLMIVRDIAYYKLSRFHEFRKNNPGLQERVLSRRLAEMVREGLLERREQGDEVSYALTKKGEDVVPILLAFLNYGVRHHADRVFRDRKPRTLKEAFPQFGAERIAHLVEAPP